MAVNVEYLNNALPLITGTEDHFSYVVSEEETYEGDDVVREGKSSNWLCIVLEGYADIMRETPRGRLRIARLGPGAIVGSIISLFRVKSHRSATLIAQAGLVLGTLNIERIHTEFLRISPELLKVALCLDKRLKEVTQRVVETHTGELDPAGFTRDRGVLVKQGAPEAALSLITEGTATLVSARKQGPVPLALLEKDDFIGPLPFLDLGQEPAAASVFASADCKTTPLDPALLQAGFRQSPAMVRAFMEHVAVCARATGALAGDPDRIAAAQKA